MPSGVNDTFPDIKRGDSMRAEWAAHVGQAITRLTQAPRAGKITIANSCGVFVGYDPDEDDDSTPSDRLFEVYNGNSVSVPAYGIMLADGVFSGQDDPEIAWPKTKAPDVYGCQYNAFINGPATIDATTFGYAQVPGRPFIIGYEPGDGTPASGSMWGPRAGSYFARKDVGGFLVLGVYDSTKSLMLAISAPMLTVRGKPTADVAAGASGTLNVYVGAFGSEVQPNGSPQITNVRNDSSCTVKGSQIATAQWTPDNSGWQFIGAKTA